MDLLQPLGQPGAQGQQQQIRKRSLLRDEVPQCRSWDIGGGHPRSWPVQVRVYHRGRKSAFHPPGGGYPTGELSPELRIGSELLGDDL